MSLSLRVRWTRQLDAALLDPSWRAHIEVKVLRFLLARYNGEQDATSLPTFPYYEGPLVPGRARTPLAQREQRRRLEDIASVERQITPGFLNSIDKGLQWWAWDDYRERQRHEKLQRAGAPESLVSMQWLWRDVSGYVFTLLLQFRKPPR